MQCFSTMFTGQFPLAHKTKSPIQALCSVLLCNGMDRMLRMCSLFGWKLSRQKLVNAWHSFLDCPTGVRQEGGAGTPLMDFSCTSNCSGALFSVDNMCSGGSAWIQKKMCCTIRSSRFDSKRWKLEKFDASVFAQCTRCVFVCMNEFVWINFVFPEECTIENKNCRMAAKIYAMLICLNKHNSDSTALNCMEKLSYFVKVVPFSDYHGRQSKNVAASTSNWTYEREKAFEYKFVQEALSGCNPVGLTVLCLLLLLLHRSFPASDIKDPSRWFKVGTYCCWPVFAQKPTRLIAKPKLII